MICAGAGAFRVVLCERRAPASKSNMTHAERHMRPLLRWWMIRAQEHLCFHKDVEAVLRVNGGYRPLKNC